MELYHLKTFAKVAEEGHLTRAAEKLHTSQPAVSGHIKTLEEELGVTLFRRTPKGMRLTVEGEKLYQKTLTALATIDELQYQARQMKHQIKGTIRLGLHIDPVYLSLDKLLSKMRRRHIGIEFNLLQRWSWQQPANIRDGVLDAGYIYRNRAQDGLIVTSLRMLPVRVVGPAKWRGRLNESDWRDIAQMPWIWVPNRCIFDRIGTREFSQRRLQPFKVAVADQEPTISALVSAGVGLGFMMEMEALALEKKGLISLWPESVGELELCFVHAANRDEDPLIQTLLSIVKEIWL